MTGREEFLVRLFTGPLLTGDAIVVLAGEDADARLTIGAQLFRQGAAALLVLSGGRKELPRHRPAADLVGPLLGMGVAPERIVLESASQNTHEQAVHVLALAAERGWRRLLLVASSYHLPRAFLTFLATLRATGRHEAVRLVPVAASQSPWDGCPPGCTSSRAVLLAEETIRLREYQAMGHCATEEEGTAYLSWWEGR